MKENAALPFVVAAVADPQVGQDSGTPRLYADSRDLLRDPGVDVVMISTPPSLHYPMAAQSLRAGKDVWIEKPPAAALHEAADLVGVASSEKRVLFFAYHARYNPAVRLAKQVLKGQAIRRIRVSYKENAANFHAPGSWVFQEGVLRDSGINVFSVLHFLLPDDGGWAVRSAHVEISAKGGGPSRASVGLTYRQNVPVEIEMDWEYMDPEIRVFEIETARGNCRIDITRGQCLLDGVPVGGQEPAAPDSLRLEYTAMLRDWYDRLQTRKTLCDLTEMELLTETELRASAASATHPPTRQV